MLYVTYINNNNPDAHKHQRQYVVHRKEGFFQEYGGKDTSEHGYGETEYGHLP